MNKTTVYLPDDLKRAVANAAASRGISEAEVIRKAITEAVARTPMSARGALFASEVLLADNVDAHLRGFGE